MLFASIYNNVLKSFFVVFHEILYGLGKVCVVRLFFELGGGPYFYGVVHAYKGNLIFDIGHAQVSLGYEHAPVAIE